MEFEKRIDASFKNEVKRIPLHLRNTDVAIRCKTHAISLVEQSGIGKITSKAEQFVLVTKFRDMLKYVIFKGSLDYQTLHIEPDDDDSRNGRNLYMSLDYIAREVGNVYASHVVSTEFELTPEEVIPYCKSLLWLCNVAVVSDVNKDLYDQYFGAVARWPSKL